MSTVGRAGRRALAAGLVALLTAVAVLPAGAVIPRDAVPSTADVREAMDGTGSWMRVVVPPDEGGPIGAKPRRCRSDLPFAAATDERSAYYTGTPRRGVDAESAVAQVIVLRFASRGDAADAVRASIRQIRGCDAWTEWVCTQCDGIADLTARPTRLGQVGQQSVAWAGTSFSNGKARQRVVVARSGATVVRVTASYGRFPGTGPFTWPERPSAATALRLTRVALQAAT
jgi:hypothetical protein